MNFDYVLLLARQRSGTSALGSILNKSSHSYYPGEPFDLSKFGQPQNFFSYKEKAILNNISLLRPDNNGKLWYGYIKQMNNAYGKKAVIDVKYNQTHHLNGDSYIPTEPSWMVTEAFKNKIPIIHLTRKNYLKSLISIVRAQNSGVWHVKSETEVPNNMVTLDASRVQALLQHSENTFLLFDRWLKNRPEVFTIDYADLFQSGGKLSDEAATGIERITGFSDLKSLRADFVKLTSNNIADVVENYDDVAKALSNTKFAWMLDD